MIEFKEFQIIGRYRDETILLNSSWKDTISLIVNMLSYDIDPTWSSGYKSWIGLVNLIEPSLELIEASCLSWIEALDILVFNFSKHQ